MAKSQQQQLKAGDRVEWETSQGKTRGRVKKKLTSATKIKTHKVAASPDRPEYLVQSDRSGKEAAHKSDSLKKVPKKKGEGEARSRTRK